MQFLPVVDKMGFDLCVRYANKINWAVPTRAFQ